MLNSLRVIKSHSFYCLPQQSVKLSNIKPSSLHPLYITVKKIKPHSHTHTHTAAITLAYTNAILFHWPRSKFCTAEFSPQGCGCIQHSNGVGSGNKTHTKKKKKGEEERGKWRGKTGLLFTMLQQTQIKVGMEGLGAIFWQKGRQQPQKRDNAEAQRLGWAENPFQIIL